jgi:4-hydroxy-tetrahydrodipicolinate reductase
MSIRIVLTGGCGQMGKQIIRSFSEDSELEFVGVVDRNNVGEDAGFIAGIKNIGVKISYNLKEVLQKAHVMVDFTCYESSCENIYTALETGTPSIIGSTGFNESDFKVFHDWFHEKGIPLFIAPNFAIGAVLMMKFSHMASRYFNSAEIIELHHDKKKDAPSGTALTTARGMELKKDKKPISDIKETLANVRGGELNGVNIHSVRLPGLLAHQEVLFGGNGEILTIKHDAMGRESFMPGLIMAVKKLKTLPPGLTLGIDKLMEI